MNFEALTSYPICWPPGKVRIPSGRRRSSQFKARAFGQIREELLTELNRMGAREVIVSSDIPSRDDGLPYAEFREPRDPGMAVYFKRRGKPYVIACDSYWKNMRAIAATLEALRSVERHASTEMMEQAFTGFAALPAHAAEASWWDVLGVTPQATGIEIERAHEALALKHHPDRGGSHDQMARINAARDVAMSERA